MDILKHKKSRPRRVILGASTLIGFTLLAVIARSIGTPVPEVGRNTLWIDTVHQGNLKIDVRANGVLAPRDSRWIVTEAPSVVEKIVLQSGASVKTDSILMRLSNPELLSQLAAANADVAAAGAVLKAKQLEVQSTHLDLKVNLEKANGEYKILAAQEEAEHNLLASGIVPALQYKKTTISLEQSKSRVAVEQSRLQEFEKTMSGQMGAQRAALELKESVRNSIQRQVNGLVVRAEINGVVQQIGVEEGQHVAVGATLAKVARLDNLIARLQVPETEARDLSMGMAASIDTHSGVVEGKISRIDAAVKNGSVLVDVMFDGQLPPNLRPDQSVDGTVHVRNMPDVLYVGRPALAEAKRELSLFKLDSKGTAERTPVKIGTTSADQVQIVHGLSAGDQVILSDTSQWDKYQKIKIR
jgi:multidrug efflux pump subunit AcrA (membrane-fusion protein)